MHDLIVCGAGPAGIGAAVAAAKRGVRTLLIERLGHVGGMHTGAGVLNWCDTPGGPVFDELYRRMADLDAARFRMDKEHYVEPGRANMDTELSKGVAMSMLQAAGAEVLLLGWVAGAVVESGRVVGVRVVDKSGTRAIEAHSVIDATADADVAADAGAGFAWGDPQDGRLQHCNFRAWFEGIDHDAYQRNKPSDGQILDWIRRAHAEGTLVPPDDLFQPEPDTFPWNQRQQAFQMTSWEFAGIDPLDGMAVSRVLVQCQVAAVQVVEFCRKHFPGHEKMSIRKMPSVLGIRESRRIIGRYTLTAEDVRAARKFDDAVACGCFYMDLHDSPPGITTPHSVEHVWSNRPPRGETFDIPYRCLTPRDLRGLLVAGRCISADRHAHGSIRAMPTCMFTGAAAGCAAAIALREGVDIADVAGERVRKEFQA